MMSTNQIREAFLTYFEERGHKRIHSSSLVPRNDPTLLFTNAGMNQFKDTFLGLEERDYERAASSQKCMRVSGKHNDLETVGRTDRHHTFFEMLGNFSFGDYFKKGAIEFAWELITQVYRLDVDRLVATVFHEDDEAFDLWSRHIGLGDSRVYRLGEADNFWSMGETGPCGPCSEIHVDLRGEGEGNPETDPQRFFEIWNLVFMQYDRDSSGRLIPLPSPSIDTGLGLERIATLLQGVESNWDTDLFRPLIEEAARLIGTTPDQDEQTRISLRILADHGRAATFLINDGVIPGNEGRGYVLRKILRRAIRHGKTLGHRQPFIYRLTEMTTDLMSMAYPELEQSRDYASRIVRAEEEKFSVVLDHGLGRLENLLEDVTARGEDVLPGQDVFRLYDTYGFPLDLARDVAQERGLTVDEAGFQAEMEQQRKRARASWKGGQKKAASPLHQELAEKGLKTEFTGYEGIEKVAGRVLAIVREGTSVETLEEGQEGEIALDRTPFYSEAGGQVSDQGVIENETLRASVKDVGSPLPGLRLHRVTMVRGRLAKGDEVYSSVDASRREAIQRNHTATHLFHAALRDVLGPHVKQAGSLVAPDRLRFDFNHYAPVTAMQLREIETIVNDKIRQNIALNTQLQDLDQAIERGAMALFGEKYDQKVRVVEIPGFSLELCGGTHVGRTGDISLFRILGESSISAGTRRVEAVSGQTAVERFLSGEDLVEALESSLHVRRDQVVATVERLTSHLKETQRRVEELRLELAQSRSADALDQVRSIGGVQVLSRQVEPLDRPALRQLADRLLNQLGSGVVVLGCPDGEKAALIAMVSDDLSGKLPAGDLIRQIAPLIQGGGGGRPALAEAGGKNARGLPEALERVYDFVESRSGQ